MIREKVKTKVCNKCGKRKLLSEFHKSMNSKYGVKAVCKECYNLYRKDKYIPIRRNITQKWSVSAIACLLRHCRCENCLMSDLESGCSMKKTVIELVRDYGKPFQYVEPLIRED